MAVYTKIIGKELYIYMNGKLTMKRWLNQARSVVFDVMTYDKHTLVSITDKGINNNVK